MTTRVYLQQGKLAEGSPQPGDLPAERVFINAGAVAELWVETESNAVPAVGKSVTFAFPRPLDLGFGRVVGTVERVLHK
jgi:hypothetical protein